MFITTSFQGARATRVPKSNTPGGLGLLSQEPAYSPFQYTPNASSLQGRAFSHYAKDPSSMGAIYIHHSRVPKYSNRGKEPAGGGWRERRASYLNHDL